MARRFAIRDVQKWYLILGGGSTMTPNNRTLGDFGGSKMTPKIGHGGVGGSKMTPKIGVTKSVRAFAFSQ